MVVNAQRDCAAHRTGRTGSQPQDLTLQLFSERGTGSSVIALDGNCAQSYRELRYRHRTRHRRAWAATEYWHALTGGQHRGRASRPIVALAAKYRLPAVYPFGYFVPTG